MKPRRPSFLVLAALGLAACAGPRAVPAESACRVEILFKAPARPFERLGDLQELVRVIPPGGAPEALRPRACALGADAVVIEKSMVVNLYDHTMVSGYAIRYRPESPAAPPAAVEEPVLPEAPPAELQHSP